MNLTMTVVVARVNEFYQEKVPTHLITCMAVGVLIYDQYFSYSHSLTCLPNTHHVLRQQLIMRLLHYKDNCLVTSCLIC
ncbi:hypothetical protein AQUCO_00900743v1 [Aquilegia coerulea]|uniref:Uncharacterized protein n=1 Tax=Aquilegia coerulea TaxID=218851 RepID=A0A2G5EFA6_AQUCA|nr:hypothetical protein AQUCO_00900743v1 [Aquilegia coerulea]